MDLFLYGRLLHTPLFATLAGAEAGVWQPADLADHAIETATGDALSGPVLVARPGAVARGMLVSQLSQSQRNRLARIEVPVRHRDEMIEVQLSDGSLRPAQVWLFPQLRGTGQPWSLEAWAQEFGPLACGIAAFSVFSAFIPEHSRSVGLGGAAGLFLLYSLLSLSLRLLGARLPERLGEHRMVTVALTMLSASLVVMASVAEPWALWVGAAGMGVGMAFLYPSLMANVVNRVHDSERASALSSFTMFFEIGTILGGVALGAVGDVFSKRAGFLGGAIIAAVGLVVLWQFVVATGAAARAHPPRPRPRPSFVSR